MYIRHIPGTQNRVADWLSRMERYFNSSTAVTHMSSMHSDVSLLLHMNLFQNSEQYDQPIGNLPEPPEQIVTPEVVQRLHMTPEETLKKLHGGRNLHFGARRTWLLLNKQFPGHRIPYKFVQDSISSCPLCQKDRLGMMDFLEPVVRHIKPPHQRSRVGVDRLTVTPAYKQGNNTLIVVVEHFSKHTGAYPAPDYSAMSLATALFQYFTTFGVFEEM